MEEKSLNNDYCEVLLVKAFKRGDQKAFEMLFNRYHKKLYGFLYNFIKSREETEEIIQESFLKVWEKRDSFNEEYPFNSYLFTIAKNTFLNHFRKNVNRRMVEEHYEYVCSAFERSADEYIIYQQTKEVIDRIVNELPLKRREIFKLRRYEGFTRGEIANNLGISIITVDSQLMKANKFIKEAFKKNYLFF